MYTTVPITAAKEAAAKEAAATEVAATRGITALLDVKVFACCVSKENVLIHCIK
jgi:hypothetical protein